MNTLLSTLRRLNAVDLLLPVGAALISAGLQQLGEREVRQRARLAELQQLVTVHRDALVAADVALPDELIADESHPVDRVTPETGFIAALANRGAAATPPAAAEVAAPAPRRRAWKLAALALGVATGVYATRPGGLVDRVRDSFGGALDELLVDDQLVYGTGEAPASVNGGLTDDPVNGGLTDEPETEPGADLVDMHACGWPGCDWSADEGPAPARVVNAALHRTKCTFRPGNAYVSG